MNTTKDVIRMTLEFPGSPNYVVVHVDRKIATQLKDRLRCEPEFELAISMIDGIVNVAYHESSY